MSLWEQWGEPVFQFIRCLEEHSRSRAGQLHKGMLIEWDARGNHRNPAEGSGEPHRGCNSYWVCAYANNQWDLAGALTSDPSQTSFFNAIKLSIGTVTVLDQDAITYSRIWVSTNGGSRARSTSGYASSPPAARAC